MSNDAKGKVTLKELNPLIKLFKLIGPAVIIAASVIGPGTVTTASAAGAETGYLLLWCVILTPFLAYTLQEPAIRFTLRTNTTLLEGIHQHISPLIAKITFIALFFGALAYQTGNFVGAAMALNFLFPTVTLTTGVFIFSIAAILIAFTGKYKLVENTSFGLILIMLASFLITMFASRPSIGGIANGIIPRIPSGAELLALGLVGTTICPDIPFALSGLTRRRWTGGMSDFDSARKDLKLNMVIVGVVTTAVLICSATVLHPQGIVVSSAADMAKQLVPVLGTYAGVLFALGLWAAGFSSAVYMTTCIPPMFAEAFNLKQDPKDIPTRVIILIIGLFPLLVTFLLKDVPVTIIISAQVLNTLILPATVVLITMLANNKSLLGTDISSKRQNMAMGVVALVVLLITIVGIPSILPAITQLF